jgi:hypothetical protein
MKGSSLLKGYAEGLAFSRAIQQSLDPRFEALLKGSPPNGTFGFEFYFRASPKIGILF